MSRVVNLYTQSCMYLIYLATGIHAQNPTLSITPIAALYGLQSLVFVLRRKCWTDGPLDPGYPGLLVLPSPQRVPFTPS